MIDLREELTVFVITTGGADYPLCIEALNNQEHCLFQLQVIRNVAPMDAAFQQMNERCNTPYFIQVDEDMILDTDAVFKLYSSISNAPADVAIYWLSLLDTDLGYPIVGVKAYRHDIIKNFPWQESHSCEMDQLFRLKQKGYRSIGIWRGTLGSHIVGKHGQNWTAESIFSRYRRLAQKTNRDSAHMGSWLEWPRLFLDRLIAIPNMHHLYAFMGWIVGLSDAGIDATEMDFRDRDKLFWDLADILNLPEGPISAVRQDLVQTTPAMREIHRDAMSEGRAFIEREPEGPRELNVYLTSRCNLACSWCHRQQGDIPAAPDFTPDLLRQALERWPSIKSVCIAGFGEPLMSDNLEGVIEEALRQEKFTSLITNGTLLSKKAPAGSKLLEMLQGLNQISVSVNAASGMEYAIVVGARDEMFGEACDGIHHLQSAGIEPVVSFVVGYSNLTNVGSYLDLAKALDCRVDLLALLPHGDKLQRYLSGDALLSDAAEVPAYLESLKHHEWAHKVRNWPALIGRDSERCSWACDSPRVAIGIDGNGDLSPCRRINPPSPTFGNISDDDAWTGGGCDEWRQGMRDKTNNLCKVCFGNWTQ